MTLPSQVRRRLLIAGGAIVLFTVIGFFILPPIVKSQLEKRLTSALGRVTTVEKVRLNPYAVSLTLEGFNVSLQDGTGSFLGWQRLHVNFDPLSSIFRAWTFGAVELDGFHASAELRSDGMFSFADILEHLKSQQDPAAAPAEKQSSRPVRVSALQVREARFDFVDQRPARPFTTTFGPVSFALSDFVSAGEAEAPYHFEAISESGERFAWSGTLSADPLESHGEFEVADLVLKKYTPYLEEHIQADINDGKLNMRGSYEANFAEAQRVLKLANGELRLRDIKVAERGATATAVDLPVLDIVGIEADAVAMQATVERVELNGGRIAARREQDGAINLLAMLQSPEPSTPTENEPPAESPLPQFSVSEVTVADFHMDLADFAAPRPARLGLEDIQFSLKNLTLSDEAVMPLQLTMNWKPQGMVRLEGTLTLRPELQAELSTDVAGLEILPLSPYLEEFINARITQGAVTSNGSARMSMVNDSPAVAFDGSVRVEKFGLVDGVYNEPLAGFAQLGLEGLKLNLASQLAVSLDEVKVVAPYARVQVHADKSINLVAVAKTAPQSVDEPSVNEAASTPALRIGMGKVLVSDGEFSLGDQSVAPNVRMSVTRFGGTVSGLSSENLARADVDLQAVVDGTGPIAITGKLDPLGAKKSVALKLDFKNVDLLPLSPYSGKYAGYELARGKLVLDVDLKVDDRKLEAGNVITLNQFTFGAPVESPDATKLPVRLGVALLKDINGQIVIDVPMAGSLDDPNFRVGRVVLRVIVNLLTKAAVSPFALLGSMFGGGGDELAYQQFQPGGSELQAEELKKLETLVKALTNRPGLSLAIEGNYDAPADTHALKQKKVAALVRAKIWEERHAADPNIAPPDELQIAFEEQAAMVKRLFDQQFPPGTDFGAPLPEVPEVTAPAETKKSFLGRVVDIVTLKNLRENASRAEETASSDEEAAEVAEGPTLEEMTGRLAETMEVSEEELRELAATRAQVVRDYFITEGGISAERLFLTQGGEASKANQGPRVFLSLQ